MHLCAYIVTDGPVGDEIEFKKELKEYLAGQLPGYMVPSFITMLKNIPLTPNGKVDLKALPQAGFIPLEEYETPRDEIEKKLVGLWSELLDIQPGAISIDRSFFELGGHSLKATTLASQIHKEFDIIIPLGEIFKAPTIKDIGNYIKNAKSANYKNIDWNVVLINEGLPQDQHLFFIHDGSGEVGGYIEFCKHITGKYNHWGIRADRLENLAPRNVTIRQLAEKYIGSMKKIQPHGPYHIAGWSLGGTIAFEMAVQLEKMNEQISFLALIDSPPPHKSLWKETGEFNLETELNFINEYSPSGEWIEEAKKAGDLDHLWLLLVDYLEAGNYDVEVIKKAIAGYGVQALPNFQQLNIKEAIYYLNLGRTLRKARDLYKPSGKIHTYIHYFAASESKDIKKEYWQRYVSEVMFLEIEGDHFSIFKEPGVIRFSKLFSEVMSVVSG
jgi:fengycin family lipopeptide synthetase D/gramicidin S synthase 2/tyrocidine synthetase-3